MDKKREFLNFLLSKVEVHEWIRLDDATLRLAIDDNYKDTKIEWIIKVYDDEDGGYTLSVFTSDSIGYSHRINDMEYAEVADLYRVVNNKIIRDEENDFFDRLLLSLKD